MMRIKTIMLVTALAVCLYSLLLLIFQRPFFAFIVSLTLLGVVMIVNQTKVQTLREPLVASDFLMYAQVFRFPRLYLPFLNIVSLFMLAVALPLSVSLVLYFEESQDIDFLKLGLLFVSSGLLFYWSAKTLPMSTEITKDYADFGLLACLAAYSVQALLPKNRQRFEAVLQRQTLPVCDEANVLADIVAIQSESFFDVRRMSHDIKPEVLDIFDGFRSEAHFAGKVSVPAWGANTLRTEFAFLSGIENSRLGLYRYYPYFFMRHLTLETLPKILQKQGYRTICLHPHEKAFFGRGRVFERLGFDEFIDIQSFQEADKFGPYVSDEAVARKVQYLLETSQQPTFIFVITMENHGPLHLEAIEDAEMEVLSDEKHGLIDRDLAIYTRHIKNTNKMLKILRDYLSAANKPAFLAFYGDHLPALSGCFERYDFTSNQSDYFLWSNYLEVRPKRHDMAVESLPSSIIHLVNSAKKLS